MEKVPLEIWTCIFNLACTDTGITGRSLSLVSHFFHEASKPFKLQSIAVYGEEQAMDFCDLLNHTPIQFRNIRNLLIYSWWKPERLLGNQDRVAEGGADDPDVGALKSILQNVAHSLEILELDCIACFYCGVIKRGSYIATRNHNEAYAPALPHLTDLTIRLNHAFLEASISADVLTAMCVPYFQNVHSLRSLRIVYPPVYMWFHFTDYIRSLAPRLKYLLLSGLAENTDTENFGLEGDSLVPESLNTTKLPQTIEKIVFEPRPPCQGRAPRDQLLAAVRRLQIEDSRVVLSPTQEDHSNSSVGGEEGWLGRINGRDLERTLGVELGDK